MLSVEWILAIPVLVSGAHLAPALVVLDESTCRNDSYCQQHEVFLHRNKLFPEWLKPYQFWSLNGTWPSKSEGHGTSTMSCLCWSSWTFLDTEGNAQVMANWPPPPTHLGSKPEPSDWFIGFCCPICLPNTCNCEPFYQSDFTVIKPFCLSGNPVTVFFS